MGFFGKTGDGNIGSRIFFHKCKDTDKRLFIIAVKMYGDVVRRAGLIVFVGHKSKDFCNFIFYIHITHSAFCRTVMNLLQKKESSGLEGC